MRLTYRDALRLLAEPDVTGRKRERNGEAGVELIEFALVFPLLLLLVLGIVDYGFMFQRFEALTNATREGARVASLPGYAQVDIEDRVADYLAAGGVPTTAGNPVVAVTAGTIPNGAGTWAATTVTLTYTHNYIFVDSLVGWWGGSLAPTTILTQSTMRNEVNGP